MQAAHRTPTQSNEIASVAHAGPTAACRNPLAVPPHADRILIIRFGALGDVVRTLPAFSSVRARYPRAHLSWLVERGAEGALRGQAGIDEIILFPREELEASLAGRRPAMLVRDVLRFVRDLRRRRFDLVLDFHGILKSGVISLLSGAPVRVGYDRPFSREGAWRFANRRVQIEPRHISRFARNAALVDFLGMESATMPTALQPGFRLGVESSAAARLRDALGAEESRVPIVIHPGTSRATPYKRYPASSWAEVARSLSRAGERCIVSCGPLEAEAELARAVVGASGGSATLAPATPALEDLAALFAHCKVLLASDSGPLHVASLVGTPVVQLLGPTDPVENAPWPGTPSRQLRVPLSCSPCRRGCRPAPCMRLLPPAAVVDAVWEVLGVRRPAAEGVR